MGVPRVLRVVVLVVVLVVGVSGFEVVAAPVVVSAAVQAKRDPREVPLLRTGVGAPPPAAPAVPAGSFGSLASVAGGGGSRFDPQRSRVVSRSMYSEEYVNPDGSHSVRQSTVPLNVRDAGGEWQPVDAGLWVDRGSERAAAKRHLLNPSLAGKADDPGLLSLQTAGGRASVGLESAAPATSRVSGSKVSYVDVAPETDLEYEVTPGAVKETIVVKKPPAAGVSSWRFRLNTEGLQPVLDSSGEVLLKDAAGVVRAAVPAVEAWDSSGTADRAPAMTGGKYKLTRDGGSWVLTVSVDEAWLRARDRVYPVFVDPTWTLGVVDSHAFKSDGASCRNCALKAGNSQSDPGGGDTYWRTAFKFDYGSLFGKTVVGARMDVTRDTSVAGSVKTWNADVYHASALDFGGLGAYLASGLIGDVGSVSGDGLTHFIRTRVEARDNGSYFMLAGSEIPGRWTYKNLGATLLVDTGSAPPAATIVAPVDTSVVSDPTPTLRVNPVTNPSGDPVSYCFKVATGADAKTGVVVDSGCLPDPSWTVPAGVLQDGSSYTWQVTTLSGITTTAPPWVGHFKVDKRIGDPGPSPVDTVGPVSVNLANGNTSVRDAGPTFTTVGGTAGVTFSYNSQQQDPTGLRAAYFNDLSHNGNINPSQQPVLVRTEPQVNVDWGVASPLPPALGSDYFVVRWEGYLRVPATGTYRFAGVHANGARVWVNNNPVYNASGPSDVNWSLTSEGGPVTEIPLTAGQSVPIKVELSKTTGAGRMRLFVKTSDGTTVPPQLVPSSWLSTSDLPALSPGWTMSADLDGTGATYTKAAVADQSIVLTDATGTKHTWTRKSTGGYTPPEGEDGILGLDTDGKVTLTEGADVYVFNPDGTLATQSSALDSRKPAALRNVYTGTPSRLRVNRPGFGRDSLLGSGDQTGQVADLVQGLEFGRWSVATGPV